MSLNRTTAAKRYAKALFELLAEKDQLDSGYSDLQQLRRIFEDNPSLSTVLSNASLELDKREAMVADLKRDASPYIQNLIQMVFDYDRMDIMVAIIEQFQVLYDEKQQIVYADVTTAVTLVGNQADVLSQTFAKRVGAKKAILRCQVDASILGGAIVKSAGIVYDGSLQTRMNQLRQRLLA